jgi:hypothetical protein
MTLVSDACTVSMLLAVSLPASPASAQPLQSHFAHVLVSTSEHIADIAINPDDGHLLVLMECTAACDGAAEYLDHYTTDGAFVMRIPLASPVNRILPAGATVFLALASKNWRADCSASRMTG